MAELIVPYADELAAWMVERGIQKLTLNRNESKQELKIEASQYATVKVVVQSATAT